MTKDNISNKNKDELSKKNLQQENKIDKPEDKNSNQVKEKIQIDSKYIKNVKYTIKIDYEEYSNQVHSIAYRSAPKNFKKNYLSFAKMRNKNFIQDIYSAYMKDALYKQSKGNVILSQAIEKQDSENTIIDTKVLQLNKLQSTEYSFDGNSDEIKQHLEELCKTYGTMINEEKTKVGSSVNLKLLKDNKIINNDLSMIIKDDNKELLDKKVNDKGKLTIKNNPKIKDGEYEFNILKIQDRKKLTESELAKKLNIENNKLNSFVYQDLLKKFDKVSNLLKKIEIFNVLEEELKDIMMPLIPKQLIEAFALNIPDIISDEKNLNIDIKRYAIRKIIISNVLQQYAEQYNIKNKSIIDLEDIFLADINIVKSQKKVSFQYLQDKIEKIDFQLKKI